jgi:hypothetical protein
MTMSSGPGVSSRTIWPPGGVLRQQEVVEPRLFLAERAVASVLLLAGDAGIDHLDAAGSAGVDQPPRVRDDRLAHALEEGAPARGLIGRLLVLEVGVLDVDDEERSGGRIEADVVGRLGIGVVEGAVRGLPAHGVLRAGKR